MSSKHKTWFPLVGAWQQKVLVEMSKTQHSKITKKCLEMAPNMYGFIYIYIYIRAGWRGEEKREQQKTHGVVSIMLHLSEKVWVGIKKTHQFEFAAWFLHKSLTYMCIYIQAGGKGGIEEGTTKHNTWFPLGGTWQNKFWSKWQKHNTLKSSKQIFSQNCSPKWLLILIYIDILAMVKGAREEKTKKHKTCRGHCYWCSRRCPQWSGR